MPPYLVICSTERVSIEQQAVIAKLCITLSIVSAKSFSSCNILIYGGNSCLQGPDCKPYLPEMLLSMPYLGYRPPYPLDVGD